MSMALSESLNHSLVVYQWSRNAFATADVLSILISFAVLYLH